MSANSMAMPSMPSRWPLALRVFGVHAGALPVAAGVSMLAASYGFSGGFMQLALVEGLVAALGSRLLGLPRWWQAINLVFLPALWLALQAEIEPVWYLAGFLLLLLTSLGALTNRVPLYLSSDRAVREIAARLPDDRPARVIDLGCGLGGMLSGLARSRPGVELHGVDSAPLPWLFSRLRLGRRACVRLGSLWSEDLSEYDLVYAYLSPEPMPELWAKVRREMRPGSLFVSNTFAVPEAPPDEIIELHDLSQARLLLWQIR
jgi:hypothetical protein